MALKDKVAFGMSLPHRSPDPIDMRAVKTVAQRAEALGFRDLWVTENTLNEESMCFDPVAVLTYAAAVTTKIRVGASVVVLAVHHPAMVAHQWATLDYVSGGRAILGVGLGRDHHYRQFEVPHEGKVARFREEVALIRALWSEEKVTFHGRFYNLDNEVMSAAAGAEAAAAVDGGRPPRRRAAQRRIGRRLDGLGRVEHQAVRRIGADPQGTRLWRGSATRRIFRSRSASSWRSTKPRRWRGASSIAGSPMSITTRPAPTFRASTELPSRCASGLRRSSRWAPTT